MDGGTDVNFGEISRSFCQWIDEQENCSTRFGHRVVDLNKKTSGKGWVVTVRNEETDQKQKIHADFVFVGAGGGSLPLLQKSGIPEVRGLWRFSDWWAVDDHPKS